MKRKKTSDNAWDRFQDEGALMLVLAYVGMAVLIGSVKLVFLP